MAMARKGTRRICVDDVDYVWKLTFNWDEFDRLLLITVELANAPGSKLLVYPIAFDINFVDFNRDQPITPKVVESFIQQGLQSGWKPSIPGPAFVVGRT